MYRQNPWKQQSRAERNWTCVQKGISQLQRLGVSSTGTVWSATASTFPPRPGAPPRGRRPPGRSRCRGRDSAGSKAADRVPAEPLDLERVQLDGHRGPLAGAVVLVDRLRDPSRFLASAELIAMPALRGCRCSA